MREFTKIKFDGKTVDCRWETGNDKDRERHEFTSSDAPDADFINATRAFVGFVVDLLDVPDSWASTLKVRGWSINSEQDSGRLGLVMTCQRDLAGAKAPWIFNLPHLKEPTEAAVAGTAGIFPAGLEEALEALTAAADRFVDGQRAQQTLKLETSKADKPAKAAER